MTEDVLLGLINACRALNDQCATLTGIVDRLNDVDLALSLRVLALEDRYGAILATLVRHENQLTEMEPDDDPEQGQS